MEPDPKSKRGLAQDALRVSEARYRRLFETAKDGILILDAHSGLITDVNPFLTTLLDYSRDDFLGKTLWDIGAFKQIQESKAAFRELQKEQYIRYENLPLESKSGRRVNVEFVSNVYDEDGKSVIQCNIRDITGRKESEASLYESQQRLADIIASAMDSIIVVDEQQDVALFNAAAEKMFLCSEAEAMGQPIERFIPQWFVSAHSGHIRAFGETGVTSRVMGALEPLWARRAGGEEFEVEASIAQTKSVGKKIFTVIMRDVSKRKQSEDALRRSEERFSKAFRNNPLAITISTEAEERYLDVNQAFLNLLGYQREDVIGRTAAELNFWVEPLDRGEIIGQLKREDFVGKRRTQYRTTKGEIREAEVWVESIEIDSQRCVLAISRDVTETMQLEAQLRQAQKMEAVGQLAGGIAHDFNNLLMVIMAHSELLLDSGLSPKAAARAEGTILAARKAADLTRQLLAFSRKQVLQPSVLNFNDVVGNMSSMLERVLGEDIDLRTVLADDLWRVQVDRSQLEQVVMNLAVNARDAMPEGGSLTIETTNVDLDSAYASQHPAVRPGEYAMLAVSDTGSGIPPEIIEKIFEPFFTTKPEGKGTGLGLSTVYGIVKQSGGFIWVYSELGKGTCFKVYFPKSKLKERAPVPKSEAPARVTRDATILVVEDDALVRPVIVEFLSGDHYKCLSADSIETATQVALEHRNEIDLLLTDVVLKGGNGRTMAKALVEKGCHFRILFMSGYAPTSVIHQGVLDEGTHFLQKPFSRMALLNKVELVLSEPTSPED